MLLNLYLFNCQVNNDFDSLVPLASKKVKGAKVSGQESAIFKLFSLGISTNRDEWVYDRDPKVLEEKVHCLVKAYDATPAKTIDFPDTIKWSRNLKRNLANDRREPFSHEKIVQASYRPYIRRWLYQSSVFTDELGLASELFPPMAENQAISFSGTGFRSGYLVLAVDGLADLHFGAAVDGYQQVARYRYTKTGERLDNVTDWALGKFQAHYGDRVAITKDDIFAYVYAVLHDPVYRETYAQNLKREFPHIPFYADFRRWRDWGQALLDLHIGYESAEPFPLVRTDVLDAKARTARQTPRVILRADRDNGVVVLDSETQLGGVPAAAWDYKLGNRSAIDWVLDQHKEKTPRDPVIREKFNTYRFADYKEQAVDLLKRVVTVSVKTVEIVDAMRTAKR